MAFERGDSIQQQLHLLNDGTWEHWTTDKGRQQMDSVGRVHEGVTIAFIASQNHNLQPQEIELQLLDAYQYSHSQGQSIGSNVQLIDEDAVLYTSPVIANGELKGMWSIVQSKGGIILGLTD